MSDIILWGRRSAFNVQKVLWALGELGLAFEHRDVGGAAGGLDTPAFLAMNPHGRVPVLGAGELRIWESHAILRYLGARYGAAPFWPDSPADQSVCDRWMDWSQTSLQPAFMRVFWGWYRTPEAQRKPSSTTAARQQCELEFERLAQELGGRPFLAGQEFSLADVPAGTALYRWFEMGLPVARPPALMAWYGRLCERPAYREHVMRPFDELYGRLEF